MRRGRSKLKPWLIVSLVFIALFLAFKWLQWSYNQRIDLGNKPGSQIFHQVFLCSMPAGVSNLKVAGMSSLSGVVWMRFQVRDVDAFLTSMKANPLTSLTVPTSGLSAYDIPPQSEADGDHYSHDVGWDAVYQVKNPETYSYESVPPGHGWFGLMVVDRSQRTVYIHGGLM